jgi:hypothetical protein
VGLKVGHVYVPAETTVPRTSCSSDIGIRCSNSVSVASGEAADPSLLSFPATPSMNSDSGAIVMSQAGDPRVVTARTLAQSNLDCHVCRCGRLTCGELANKDVANLQGLKGSCRRNRRRRRKHATASRERDRPETCIRTGPAAKDLHRRRPGATVDDLPKAHRLDELLRVPDFLGPVDHRRGSKRPRDTIGKPRKKTVRVEAIRVDDASSDAAQLTLAIAESAIS